MKKPYHMTPGASQGNAFTRHLRDEPSIFAEDSNFSSNASERATKARETCEAKGLNTAQIPGMGVNHFDNAKRKDFHVVRQRSLDSRGRPVVSMEPRKTGAISIFPSTDASRAKTNKILRGAMP